MYSSISSKIYIVKKNNEWIQHFFVREIWCEKNKQNLQIRHEPASAARVNQGVEPWVSQQPLASTTSENKQLVIQGGPERE
jgi:hypothetical protein